MQYLSDIPREQWGSEEERLEFLHRQFSDAHSAYWRLLDSGYFGSTKHKGSQRAKEYWSNVTSAERRLKEFSKLINLSPWEKVED